MAITPTLDRTLFTVPFTSSNDFTELADNCERFVEVIVECDDPAQKMALCGRLSACLDLLQPTLLEPIPAYLVASLTVEDIPAELPTLEMEADQLGDYCQALTQLLLSGSLATKTELTIRDLLYQLVFYFAGMLKAPRWLKTEDALIPLA
jgi:hypothetical protein